MPTNRLTLPLNREVDDSFRRRFRSDVSECAPSQICLLLLRQLQRGGLIAGDNVENLVYRHAERAADRRGSAEHRRLCGRTEKIFDRLFNYP